jgi:hypothetical protein
MTLRLRLRSNMRQRSLAAVCGVAILAVAGPVLADEKENEICANAAEDAQGLQREGKLTQARDKLVACARASCPAFIRKDCSGWLADVDKSMPSVVVRAVDAQNRDLANVRVLIDGKVVAEKLDGRAVPLDPGDHVVRYEAPSFTPVTEKVLVRQGEANRLLTVTLRPTSGAGGPGDAKGNGSEGRGGVPLISWVLGGTGLAFAGAGGLLWGMGRSDHGSLEDGCARTSSCRQDDVDSAQTKLLIGDIALGAGLVAIGAAVVLAVVGRPASKPPAPNGSTDGAPLRVVGRNASAWR